MSVKIKVCGMRDRKNILEVAELRPDFMGFIFYPGSPRFVGNNFILPELPVDVKKAGVFVNEGTGAVVNTIAAHELDYVQLHGDESPEQCAEINKYAPVIKAFGIDETFDFKCLKSYVNVCKYFLFDTKSASHGGTGKSFDRSLLEKYNYDVPYFMSGGISASDLKPEGREKLNIKPYGFDLNSRFETTPGIKDVSLLREILNRSRDDHQSLNTGK